ncbi:MAG: proprotein convertase P-domain-containing protein [Bdellovibrionota bacterium]
MLQLRRTFAQKICFTLCVFWSFAAAKKVETRTTCFPENNLNLEDRLDRKDANITEVEFNRIIDQVTSYYSSIIEAHGSKFVVYKKWEDATVNAYAEQEGDEWRVAMFGGLARRPEVTADGFAMVVCHELGHHLAGFPLKGARWAASEGQSDYFATQACALKLWSNDLERNAEFRSVVPSFIKEKCDSVYQEEGRQNICYRATMAGQSLANLLAKLDVVSTPEIEHPEERRVPSTLSSHPTAQCRLDTYFSGALCDMEFPDDLIPGRMHPEGQSSLGAEKLAALYSCTDTDLYTLGKRPRCWFAPQMYIKADFAKVTAVESVGNGNGVWEPGESYEINLPLVNRLTTPLEGAKLQLSLGDQYFEESFPLIATGESSYASNPVVLKSLNDGQCGDRFSVKASVVVGKWKKDTSFDFVLGKDMSVEQVERQMNASIPDHDEQGVVSTIAGNLSQRTHLIKVNVDITHRYIGDLSIQLLTPSGKEHILLKPKAGDSGTDLKKTFDVPLNEEQIDGDWQLKVADHTERDAGVLNSWSIDFYNIVCEPTISVVSKK